MKVQFELTIGENKFTLSEDVETHADFFKKLDFYSALPKVGPNGETDLVLRHRKAKTKDGKPCDYYSIVSAKAKQEYRFGQSQGVNGQLFPKGWEPLYNAGGDESSEENAAPVAGGLGAPVAAAPAATKAAPAAGLGAAQAAPTPAPAAAAPAATPAAANPQVQQQAKNVLAKFGI